MRFSVVAAVSIAASCVLPVLAAPTPVFESVFELPLRYAIFADS